MLTEHEEQSLLFEWAKFDRRLDVMFAIPNGANKSIVTAMKFKREGLKKGVPDIFLPVSNKHHHGLFIEMKRQKGKTSPEQDEWYELLMKNHYKCHVCYGFEEAKKAITDYLGGEQ